VSDKNSTVVGIVT